MGDYQGSYNSAQSKFSLSVEMKGKIREVSLCHKFSSRFIDAVSQRHFSQSVSPQDPIHYETGREC